MSGIPEQIGGYRIEWVLGFCGISRCAGAAWEPVAGVFGECPGEGGV